jgi:hypothetical protein
MPALRYLKLGGTRAHVDLHRLFARGEMMRLCNDSLASGTKTTKERALIVIAAKRRDTGVSIWTANGR